MQREKHAYRHPTAPFTLLVLIIYKHNTLELLFCFRSYFFVTAVLRPQPMPFTLTYDRRNHTLSGLFHRPHYRYGIPDCSHSFPVVTNTTKALAEMVGTRGICHFASAHVATAQGRSSCPLLRFLVFIARWRPPAWLFSCG